MSDENFVPMRISDTRSVPVDAAPHDVFWLLTPEGEREWVPGWDPQYLGSPELREGLIFSTAADGKLTVWVVNEVDHERCRASYHRFTPSLKSGLVEVRCDSNSRGGTELTVSYSMVGLSEAGNREIQASSAAFENYIDGWSVAISNALEKKGPASGMEADRA